MPRTRGTKQKPLELNNGHGYALTHVSLLSEDASDNVRQVAKVRGARVGERDSDNGLDTGEALTEAVVDLL